MRFDRHVRRLISLGTVVFFVLSLGLVSATAVAAQSGPAQGSASADKDKDKDDKDDGSSDPGDDPGNNKSGDLRLATNSLPTMLAGQEGWVSLLWYAETDVCNVQVTAKTKDVGVTYPTNTGSFSSLYTNNALAETNLDYTAFRITAPSKAGTTEIEFEATFTRLKDSAALKKADNLVVKSVADCSGDSGKVKVKVPLTVQAPSGDAVALQTPTVQVKKGGPTWVPIAFKGNAPDLNNFRVSVSAPDGFEVVYPGDGTSSGLNGDTRLPVGVVDSAAIRLDPLTTEAGTYKLPVTATWSGGSWSGTISVTVVS